MKISLVLLLISLTTQFDLSSLQSLTQNNNLSSIINSLTNQNPQNQSQFQNQNIFNQNQYSNQRQNNNQFSNSRQPQNNNNRSQNNNSKPKKTSKTKSIFNGLKGIMSRKQTPISECTYIINLSKIIKNFPIKAECRPLIMEFEDGYNSRMKSIFACTQKSEKGTINLMVYLETKSFMDLAKNKNNIIKALNNPDIVYWKISNTKEFLDGFNPMNSISCEKIKMAFSLFD